MVTSCGLRKKVFLRLKSSICRLVKVLYKKVLLLCRIFMAGQNVTFFNVWRQMVGIFCLKCQTTLVITLNFSFSKLKHSMYSTKFMKISLKKPTTQVLSMKMILQNLFPCEDEFYVFQHSVRWKYIKSRIN